MPTYIDPGFSVHAHGRLEHVVRGAERALAHEQIMLLMSANEKDGVAELARRDASLFIEPIPRFQPVTGEEAKGWDVAWQKHTNWLDRAAAWEGSPFPDAVIAVLEAGIHPEDTTVFRSDVLLGYFNWRNKPELLRAALKHGAGPDMPPDRHSPRPRSLVYSVVTWMQPLFAVAGIGENSRSLLERIECANILLGAGAKLVDPVRRVRPDGTIPDDGTVTSLGVLCNPWYESIHPWLHERLDALVRKLVAHGASMDMRTGLEDLPPVIRAIREKNRPMALLLIELGCKTDDEFIVRRLEPVKSLIEEATESLGAGFAAEVIEALMRRRLAATQEPNPVHDLAPAGRGRRVTRV
jgi:hypothetical protein